MIHFQKVEKRFGPKVQALKNLTLKVKEGETLVLLGKSGSGKTTALKLMSPSGSYNPSPLGEGKI